VTVHGRPRLRRAETLALTLLASGGIAAIWRLNEAAAQAYRTGHACTAESILQVAEAAEEAWLRAEVAREAAV
jgi:hypothetical protein